MPQINAVKFPKNLLICYRKGGKARMAFCYSLINKRDACIRCNQCRNQGEVTDANRTGKLCDAEIMRI